MAQAPVRARERTRKSDPKSFRYLAATWRPDWRDADAYTKKRSFADWAWEFFRRSPSYEQFYLSRMAKYEKQPDLIREAEKLTLERDDSGNFPDTPDDPQLAKLFRIMEGANLLYDLLIFPRPPWQDKVELKIEDIAYCLGGKAASAEMAYPREDEVLCLFGLHLPIDAQLSKIKSVLIREKKRLGLSDKKGRELVYITYIRLLDAEYDEESLGEMASVLFPNKSRKIVDNYNAEGSVRDSRAAAHALTNGGWRSLLFK